MIAGSLGLFAIVLLIFGSDLFFAPKFAETTHNARKRDAVQPPKIGARDRSVETSVDHNTTTDAPAAQSALIDDDGKTLWASPTSGPTLDLRYLPPGMQIIVALRPRALLDQAEGEKILAALGPTGERGVHYIEQAIGLPLRDLERLTVAASVGTTGNWLTTFVAVPTNAISLDALRSSIPDRAFYLPDTHAGKLLIVAPQAVIDDIMHLGGAPPPLRRDMERLLDHTDADRHVTMLIAPNFLFGEGQGLFRGAMARLRGPLFWFLGDEFSAAALSLHWDENFFAELVSVPTADTPPERAAQILVERAREIPDRVENYVLDLRTSPYGRRIVARFPAMLRKLTIYTRSYFDRDHAILRAYLPAVAGHNLLMGAELTLAESFGEVAAATGANVTSSTRSASSSPTAALQKPTSLRFARETLESALAQLSEDIGVEIIIIGPDLQSEGITKNQSFAIDLENQPAEKILIEILRLANPDKSATGPADDRQKLVYVFKPKAPGGPDVIHITTRARATERGDPLPAVFTGIK